MPELQKASGDETPKTSLRPPARLKRRADFVRAGRGSRAHRLSFTLQVARRNEGEPAPPRFGFTVTKKIGSAALRNRIRRRLKEALRLLPHLSARPGYDYVIFARQAALSQDFKTLQQELARAIDDVHAAGGKQAARKSKPRHPAGAAGSSQKD